MKKLQIALSFNKMCNSLKNSWNKKIETHTVNEVNKQNDFSIYKDTGTGNENGEYLNKCLPTNNLEEYDKISNPHNKTDRLNLSERKEDTQKSHDSAESVERRFLKTYQNKINNKDINSRGEFNKSDQFSNKNKDSTSSRYYYASLKHGFERIKNFKSFSRLVPAWPLAVIYTLVNPENFRFNSINYKENHFHESEEKNYKNDEDDQRSKWDGTDLDDMPPLEPAAYPLVLEDLDDEDSSETLKQERSCLLQA